MPRKPTTISGQLRLAIKKSGMTQYAICKETGIDKAAMSRFMSKGTGLTTATVDKLADVLGLELVPKKRKRR